MTVSFVAVFIVFLHSYSQSFKNAPGIARFQADLREYPHVEAARNRHAAAYCDPPSSRD
jgi:hypothetical protein